MKECSEEIEEILTDSKLDCSLMDDHMVYKIQTFCKSLKEENVLIPYNLFKINNAAFLSILATGMTYIVVIIQFKTAELPLKA